MPLTSTLTRLKSPEIIDSRFDRNNLKLNLTNTTSQHLHESNLHLRDYRNSAFTTDDSSAITSPGDEDNWSTCSDYHRDLTSPLSPNGYGLSGDEGESVIDRIRRKSFYSRFNENKRPRKSSLSYYKDDYSFDRRPLDYRSLDRRSSYSTTDPVKREYKPYTKSSSLLSDGYVNLPSKYQTYNPKISKRSPLLYSPEVEENDFDSFGSTEKSRK